jgi:NAD(P)H-hydrate repair Nnr-like enzyme with NAD(P)H-hydrate epimerase domain
MTALAMAGEDGADAARALHVLAGPGECLGDGLVVGAVRDEALVFLQQPVEQDEGFLRQEPET